LPAVSAAAAGSEPAFPPPPTEQPTSGVAPPFRLTHSPTGVFSPSNRLSASLTCVRAM